MTLLCVLFMFFSAEAFVGLPNHFGSELRVTAVSPELNAESSVKDGWYIDIDISSIKLKKNKVILTTTGSISGDKNHLSATGWYRINKRCYVGGGSQVSSGLKLSHKATIICAFYRSHSVTAEIFGTANIKSNKLAGAGMRYTRRKKLSVYGSGHRAKEGLIFALGLSIPLDPSILGFK